MSKTEAALGSCLDKEYMVHSIARAMDSRYDYDRGRVLATHPDILRIQKNDHFRFLGRILKKNHSFGQKKSIIYF